MKSDDSLPSFLVERYRDWKSVDHADNLERFRILAEYGQAPGTMAITCCDSRVQVTSIFEVEEGEFFVHRNIAALVPPLDRESRRIGTPAAVEYAVKELEVARILVLGHSNCGGVQGCIDMHAGTENPPPHELPFVAEWLNILRPALPGVAGIADPERKRTALERQAVILSLENLMTYPFVAEAVGAGALTLHGLWHDIRSGAVLEYDRRTGTFEDL